MEKLAYLLKRRCPLVFQVVEKLARWLVSLRFGRRLSRALEKAQLHGRVHGSAASIRPLTLADIEGLEELLVGTSNERLRYFQPHRLDRKGLEQVIVSPAFMTYGIYIDSRLAAYALLKIAPTGSAFIGLLVSPEFGRLGLGKFIVAYLYWQASLAGLRTRSTISRHNPASLRAHEAVSNFRVVSELPDDYMMIEFPRVPRGKPELNLP